MRRQRLPNGHDLVHAAAIEIGTGRSSSLIKECTSSSGSAQSKLPFLSAVQPSSDMITM